MFEKFGEFNSVQELNSKAEELKKANDKDGLIVLAKENGLDSEDAEDYMEDYLPELASDLQAAIGKIKVEAEHLKVAGILGDWKSAIIDMCTENVELRAAVRRKDKSLCGCMAALIKFAFENKEQVSEEIVKACKVKHNGKEEPMRSPLYLGVPNKATVRKIVSEYYIGGAS